jgi:carbonic anhydrase
VVGSVEYAAEHLGSILLMVLGHQGCGAVKAAVATVTEGAHQEGEIQSFVDPLVPVVKKTKRKTPKASRRRSPSSRSRPTSSTAWTS